MTRSRLTRFAVLLVAAVGALSLVATASPAIAASISTLLPRSWIVPLSSVRRSFPQVTGQAETGKNTTSSGKPVASRQVIYANRGASRKVTLSVDRYANPKRASSAFKEAAGKSRIVPGFSPLPAPKVGQHSSAGTVTQGEETHVGIAALQGSLVVQATIAGYQATRANILTLGSLTRVEVATAKLKCSEQRGCSPR